MVERDNTFGGRAGEVRSKTLMVTMVSAPAISARARIGAVAAVMSWVFTVAFETIWIGRKTLLSFSQQ